MLDSAFFDVIGPNLLIFEQKNHKKANGCFDVILPYNKNNYPKPLISGPV
jgi:hypothetical protein